MNGSLDTFYKYLECLKYLEYLEYLEYFEYFEYFELTLSTLHFSSLVTSDVLYTLAHL